MSRLPEPGQIRAQLDLLAKQIEGLRRQISGDDLTTLMRLLEVAEDAFRQAAVRRRQYRVAVHHMVNIRRQVQYTTGQLLPLPDYEPLSAIERAQTSTRPTARVHRVRRLTAPSLRRRLAICGAAVVGQGMIYYYWLATAIAHHWGHLSIDRTGRAIVASLYTDAALILLGVIGYFMSKWLAEGK